MESLPPPPPDDVVASKTTSDQTGEMKEKSNDIVNITSSLAQLDVEKDEKVDMKEENFSSLSTEELGLDGLEATTPPAVRNILSCVIEPDKKSLIAEVKTIARKAIKTLKKYRLQERGSLFSPLINHVSDADIQLYSKQTIIPASHCNCAISFAKQLFYRGLIASVRWEDTDGVKLEVPFEDFSLAESIQKRQCFVAFVLTGIYSFSNGFLIPVDFALICGGETSEPPLQRCQKIVSKLEEGDFAKVLQKVRALFKKGRPRESLVNDINMHVGKLRFVVKQLEMIKCIILNTSEANESPTATHVQIRSDSAMSMYLRVVLGLKDDVFSVQDIASSQQLLECEQELQRRSLLIIRKHWDPISTKLSNASNGNMSLSKWIS